MAYDKIKQESFGNIGGINTKASIYMNDITECRDLQNVNFLVPGAWNKRPGTDYYLGATVQGKITGLFEFERLNGSSFLIATANTNAYTVSTSSFSAFKTGLTNNAIFDFVPFVDRLFMANGYEFFKTDGSQSSNYSLPPGLTSSFSGSTIGGGGLSGVFTIAYGYLNDRGYLGPPSNGITISLNGISYGTIRYAGFTTPSGYGITSIAIYRTTPGGVDLTGITYLPAGATQIDINETFPLSSFLAPETTWFTLAPKYIEIYNNQLFLSGFSAFPSTAFWSQVGEPEGIEPEFNAEFRTNDGDRIMGMKSYLSSLYVFKERSFHRISGDNPTNFVIQEVSDSYGCISNRAVVVWENTMWFLDPKGICEWNGSDVQIVSTRLEDIFNRMNLSAAKENAVAIHNRQFNEVWFSIPIDGATENNIIIVYDYVSKAWTTYTGIKISSLALIKQGFSLKTPVFGGYTGTVSYFGSSLTYDAGNAITCMIKPSFLHELGQTFEKQYRRFYLNVEPVIGVTQPIDINLRTNYGSSIQISRTIYQNPFQTRIDFGLPCRSIQPEIVQSSASLPFRVYGFTFESRYQRSV